MNQERICRILLSPLTSEKSSKITEDHNQYVFRVLKNSTKREVKLAVELFFDVRVAAVKTLVVRGKTKRTKFGQGRCSDWKKAYVSLAQGEELSYTERNEERA